MREIREELGMEARTGAFLGAVENSFIQHGKPHAEINLVYAVEISDGELCSQEDWIEFKWCDLNRLDSANLLPAVFRRLADWPDVRFDC